MAKSDVQITISAVDQATNEIKKVQMSLDSVTNSLSNMVSNITTLGAGGALVATLKTFTNAAKDYGEQIDKISIFTGASAEQASELAAIFQRGGSEAEQATSMMVRFGKNVGQSMDEMKTKGDKSNDMFTRMGFTLQDLQGKNLVDVFRAAASSINELGSAAERDQVSMALFGRAGSDMVKVLRLTSDQMDEAVANAKALGLILDESSAGSFEEYKVQTLRVTEALTGMEVQIGAALLPTMEAMNDAIIESIQWYIDLDKGTKDAVNSTVIFGAEAAIAVGGVFALQGAIKLMNVAFLATPLGRIVAITAAIYELATATAKYNDEQIRKHGGNVIIDPDTGMPTQIPGSYPLGVNGDTQNAYLNMDYGVPTDKDMAAGQAIAAKSAASAGLRDPYVKPGNSHAADAAARRLEEANRKVENLMAELNQKITDQFGTTYETSIAKLNTEMTKWQNDVDKMAEAGADTSGLAEKLKAYEVVFKEKITKIWRESWQDVKDQTSLIDAQLLEDKNAEADEELRITITRLNLEREAKKTHVMQDKNDHEAELAVDKEFNGLIALASKKTAETIIDNDISVYQKRIELNNELVVLEGKTQAQVDALNQAELIKEINILDQKMLLCQKDSDEYLKLARLKYDAKNQQYAMNGNDPATSYAEALRRMSTVQTDYAGIIVQSWTDIDNGVMTHMENIVNQTESLSQGIVGIISDMTKSIEKMMVDMLYKQYVMKPIQSWFSSIVGGMLGGSIGGTNIPTAALTAQNNMLGAFSGSYADYKNPFKFASGGSYPGGMALVGEQGPELINFNRPGQVYTAGQTQQMMSGGTTSSVSVTLINNTGTATTATATSSYDGAVRAYIIDVVLDKATRDSTFRAAFGGAR